MRELYLVVIRVSLNLKLLIVIRLDVSFETVKSIT